MYKGSRVLNFSLFTIYIVLLGYPYTYKYQKIFLFLRPKKFQGLGKGFKTFCPFNRHKHKQVPSKIRQCMENGRDSSVGRAED